jgi:deoxyadenosine/deoxycytidine kinase
VVRKPLILAVAGLQGSGKTTLARALARKFNWDLVAESSTAMRYIPELFENMRRLAFEAQIGFLSNKAIAIQEKIAAGVPIVLDRTLHEDWHVFARYFRSIDMIDDRAFSTYVAVADYFTSVIPAPGLVLFCDCPLEVAKGRIDGRKRESQSRYPANHLESIAELYATWFDDYQAGPLARIDTVKHDFRDEGVLHLISDEVAELLTNPPSREQLDLFFAAAESTAESPSRIVELVRGVDETRIVVDWERAGKLPLRLPLGAFAYVAAPFTEFARSETAASTDQSDELLPAATLHGKIPVGEYRRALLGLENRLANHELETLIPHRDVNLWGRKTVLPNDVYAHCMLAVQKADLVVAILGHSPGAHFEVGLAQGLGKPVLLIHCSEIPPSYLATGMSFAAKRTFIARCERVRDIPSVLTRPNVETFLKSVLTV